MPNAGRTGLRGACPLLEANRLVDIRAVRDANAVVLLSAYYDRAALDPMLAGVESAAGSWSMWPKFAWQILKSPVMQKHFAD